MTESTEFIPKVDDGMTKKFTFVAEQPNRDMLTFTSKKHHTINHSELAMCAGARSGKVEDAEHAGQNSPSDTYA